MKQRLTFVVPGENDEASIDYSGVDRLKRDCVGHLSTSEVQQLIEHHSLHDNMPFRDIVVVMIR